VREARDNAEVSGLSVDDIANHYARLIARLRTRPVVIGHSIGGLIAQNLLARDLAVAAVAFDPVRVNRVLPLSLAQMVSDSPELSNPANRNRAVRLTPEQFQRGFGNAVSLAESTQLFRDWAVPAPGRPLFEPAFTRFFREWSPAADIHPPRNPLLLVSTRDDGRNRGTPDAASLSSFRKYRHSTATTDLIELPHKGNTLVIDSGWSEVAELSLRWLADQLLGAPSRPLQLTG
jgi:pimeloyl-ACP methyl ester carboxylesterase